ncbi:hypothetical protein AGMMS49982_17250 [Bacteroidia bacterium]|nr:hypothetical protein AGMMS49982_17250 [Bacteroidia bacterium]
MIEQEFRDKYLDTIICGDCLATMKEMPSNSADLELSDKQIERQDFVDNAIFELLQSLNPMEEQFDWDIEMIGDIRDTIQSWIIDKTHCSEQDFYPFIAE